MRRALRSLTVLAAFPAIAAAQPAAPQPPPPAEPAPPGAAATPPAQPPAETPPAEPVADEPKPVAGYDKGFFLRGPDDRFSLKLTGRIQPFVNFQRTGTPSATDPDEQIIDWKNNFEVRRARLIFEGHLGSKALTYKFQTDYGKGVVSIKDVHFDVALTKDVWVRFGQWKRPFSRQQITSSGRLELTDRAITDKAFGAGRDVGIAIRNDYEKSPELEWTVGVWNGTGDAPKATVVVDPMTGVGTVTSNTNVPAKFRPALIGRFGLNRNGLKGYSEADLEGGPLRWGVAASVWLEGDFDDNDQSNQKAELDYIVKVQGFSSTGGLYAQTAQDGPNIADAELALVGFHLQAGYMFDKHWQGAARYAYINDPRQKALTTADQQEIAAAINYFSHGRGHDEKYQAGLRFIKNGDASFTDAMLFELGANIGW